MYIYIYIWSTYSKKRKKRTNVIFYNNYVSLPNFGYALWTSLVTWVLAAARDFGFLPWWLLNSQNSQSRNIGLSHMATALQRKGQFSILPSSVHKIAGIYVDLCWFMDGISGCSPQIMSEINIKDIKATNLAKMFTPNMIKSCSPQIYPNLATSAGFW